MKKQQWIIAGTVTVTIMMAFLAIAAKAWQYRTAAIRAEAARDEAVRQTVAEYNQALRIMISYEAGLTGTDSKLVCAQKLTTLLYSRTDFSGAFIPTNSDILRYALTVTGRMKNYCDSLSYTLVWLLQLFDIPARPVVFVAQSHLEGRKLEDTHTMVEAMFPEGPVALDPTFDVTYASTEAPDRPIGAEQIYMNARRGTLAWTYLAPPRPGRSVEQYYIQLETLFYAVGGRELPGVFKPIEMPKGWQDQVRSLYTKKD